MKYIPVEEVALNYFDQSCRIVENTQAGETAATKAALNEEVEKAVAAFRDALVTDLTFQLKEKNIEVKD